MYFSMKNSFVLMNFSYIDKYLYIFKNASLHFFYSKFINLKKFTFRSKVPKLNSKAPRKGTDKGTAIIKIRPQK